MYRRSNMDRFDYTVYSPYLLPVSLSSLWKGKAASVTAMIVEADRASYSLRLLRREDVSNDFLSPLPLPVGIY
jgi:hypothetical protein